ncbi:hypothetical protein [Hymenobacter cellulosivorans]|uniref:Uncharacterized protein n=1 Tax=Hymenobacter cellulosivorans TaxID=2932249 RepID=A0ABY4F9R5_9BACT|nr:hypothetical protein [Hymenobacter cellulosivorans]UOQ52921.1 hypothetical protein MUN80_24675 [Hymenobacter cellulosivorans]
MLSRILCVVLLLALPLTSLGQAYQSSNGFFFLPEVDVAQFQGRPYRYQVSVRYQPADTTAKVGVWAMQVGKNEYDFKQRDYPTQTIRPNEWQTNTIQGQIRPGVRRLWFYSTLAGNGTFWFDNLTLQVQQPNGTWQPVPIKNGDFEHSATPLAGYEMADKVLPAGVVAALAPGQGPDQSQALRITMTGARW